MTNEELVEHIQKATITSALGGQVSAQQAREFVDMAVDQTAVLGQVRVETDIQTSYEIHEISLGEPVTTGGTEGTAPVAADVVTPSIGKKILQPKEIVAAFDVTFDMVRKNIEGTGLNETLNRIFANRFGKDIVMMAFSGDTAIAGSTRTDKALKVIDGYVKRMLADATVNDYAIPGTPTYSGKSGVFASMLKLLPKDYRDDRGQLAYFVSQNVLDSYEDEISERQTAAADNILFGTNAVTTHKRVRIIPVFRLADNRIILTPTRNLAVGFGRRMSVGMDVYNRRRTVEVTITADVDVNYVKGQAVVLGS